jgi:hypothetical protein
MEERARGLAGDSGDAVRGREPRARGGGGEASEDLLLPTLAKGVRFPRGRCRIGNLTPPGSWSSALPEGEGWR